jgi:hypothetical protein
MGLSDRLGAHRCALCGVRLSPASPSDVFCGQYCQTVWMTNRLGGMDPHGHASIHQNDHGEFDPEQVREEAAPPSWLGVAAYSGPECSEVLPSRPDQPDSGAGWSAPPLGPALTVDDLWLYPGTCLLYVPGLQLHYGLGEAGRALMAMETTESALTTYRLEVGQPRNGMLAPEGEVSTPGTMLGGPVTFEWPALEDIDPEPEPDAPFPLERISQMVTDHGGRWQVTRWDEVPEVFRPSRSCPSCHASAQPKVVNARFPAFWPEPTNPGAVSHHLMVVNARFPAFWPEPTNPGAERFGTGSVSHHLMTKVVCGACYLPHPGPQLVPLWRRVPHGTEFAVVAEKGLLKQMVSQEAISRLRPEVGALVWERLHHELAVALSPWRCALRGCSSRACVWYMLGANLWYEGNQWIIRDNEPLRIGMCASHGNKLRYDLMGDLAYVDRMDYRTGRNRFRIM